MNATETTRSYRDQLAQQILEQPDHQASYGPLPVSRPLAKALLQKATLDIFCTPCSPKVSSASDAE